MREMGRRERWEEILLHHTSVRKINIWRAAMILLTQANGPPPIPLVSNQLDIAIWAGAGTGKSNQQLYWNPYLHILESLLGLSEDYFSGLEIVLATRVINIYLRFVLFRSFAEHCRENSVHSSQINQKSLNFTLDPVLCVLFWDQLGDHRECRDQTRDDCVEACMYPLSYSSTMDPILISIVIIYFLFLEWSFCRVER